MILFVISLYNPLAGSGDQDYSLRGKAIQKETAAVWTKVAGISGAELR